MCPGRKGRRIALLLLSSLQTSFLPVTGVLIFFPQNTRFFLYSSCRCDSAFFCGIFLYYIIPTASAQFFTCYFFIFGWKIQLARYAKINAADVPTAPAFNPPWNNPKNPLSFTP